MSIDARSDGEEPQMSSLLEASELRYRRLFEAARDGILILDVKTAQIQDANPFVCDLLGYAHEEMVGKKIWEIGAFRDVPASRRNFRELQRTDYIRYEDLPLRTATGDEIAVEFVSNVYRAGDEEVIQCNIRDISQRKTGAEENARLLQAVRQTAEAIMMTDVHGAIVYVNPAFERLSGWTSQEVLGMNPRILKSGEQDDEFYREMWAALARGETWAGRLVNRRKDGTLFEEETRISPVWDGAGEIVNYVAVKRDISKEVRLEQQLLQAHKMEAVGRLAGGIAHDFNNLLGVIVGYGETLREQLADQEPLVGEVDQILKAAEQASKLTQQLLAVGRKQIVQPKPLDLNSVVSDMEKMLRHLLGTGVELVTRLDARAGTVRADEGQVEQILMNLVLNARDAMAEGGRITIETLDASQDADHAAVRPSTRPGSYVMLAVTDTGAGMDAAVQAQMFDPFFTTKGAGKGTGLGLSTVYGIVDQSQGFVGVRSKVGEGTTVKIYLPRVEEELRSKEVPREEDPRLSLNGRETVLLAEDDEALRKLLRGALEASGYSVLAACSGAEALQLAEAHAGPIEILVTDVMMPGLTGPEIAELIANKRPTIKVLFISGYSQDAVGRSTLLARPRAFLSKPFRLEAFQRRVRELLDGEGEAQRPRASARELGYGTGKLDTSSQRNGPNGSGPRTQGAEE